ncbi:MAG: hypothetical protein ABW252_01750 [Polyangiales bacterium]
MSKQSPNWVNGLRDAADRGARGATGEVIRGTQPSLLAADAVHVLTSALMAALVVAAATLRADLARGTFDVVALLLRTAAVAFVLRAVGALLWFVRRVVKNRHASAWTLAWSEHGILLRTHRETVWAAREDVIGCGRADAHAPRLAVAALHPLFLVLRAQRAPHWWTLPPYFTAGSELLRARIDRWLDTTRARDGARPPLASSGAHSSDATQRYQRAAEGAPEPDDVVVPEGRGYLRRAPYGGLLALVFVADALHMAGDERARLLSPALLAALLVVGTLVAWFAWVRRRRAVRLGIAMVLTPSELLVRGSHGVVALGHRELTAVEVSTKLAWSPFGGSYAVRVLWLEARDGTRMRFDEDFLGVPASVLARLIDAYRADASSDDDGAPASQGSGAGGGISPRDGTTATATTST